MKIYVQLCMCIALTQFTADDIDCSKTAMSHDNTIISVRPSVSLSLSLSDLRPYIRNGP